MNDNTKKNVVRTLTDFVSSYVTASILVLMLYTGIVFVWSLDYNWRQLAGWCLLLGTFAWIVTDYNTHEKNKKDEESEQWRVAYDLGRKNGIQEGLTQAKEANKEASNARTTANTTASAKRA
jgi:hypothetical protein